MVTTFPHAVFIFLLFALLLWKDEWFGVLCLLSGFILFDRNFAYTHLEFAGKALYITEYVLFLWTLKMLTRPSQLWRTFSEWPVLLKFAWCLYLAAGLISCARGLYTYTAMSVLRDAALCYYALFALLASSLNLSRER